MKAIRIFQFGVFCVSALFFAAQGALAQDVQKGGDPEKIRIGDHEYTRGEIIADFLNVAFSNAMWNEDADKRNELGFAKIIDEYISYDRKSEQDHLGKARNGQFRWWTEHIHSDGKWPSRGVINKWSKEIRVGIDWPAFKQAKEPSKDREILHRAALKYAAQIFPYTGFPYTVLSLDDPQDEAERRGQIRLVAGLAEGPGDVRTHARMNSFQFNPFATEWLNFGGVLFESSDYEYMDGYLLPSINNDLDLSVCKVAKSLPEQVTENLVLECLTRSLGLPGNSSNPESHLRSRSSASLPKLVPDLSDYDAYMVKLLYCKKIKPGMDKNEVFELLTRRNDCF